VTGWRIGIDVGGTFTDLVAVPGDGVSWDLGGALAHKVPSTPDDPSEGVGIGLAQLLDRGVDGGIDAGAVVAVTHGTTIGLNAILQGRVARAALVTSRGHRDVLQIARARMPRSFDLHASPPPPIVPRGHVLEVEHRFTPDGVPLAGAPPSVELVERLRRIDPEVVVVSLLGGYAAPAGERALAERLAAELDVPVTSAANVWPQVGEYERTTLALLDAQITPLMTGYFTALRERLRLLHVDARLYISTSNGGSVSIDEAIRRPIQTVLSGPAAGVSAAASSWPGLNMVTVDMGGTSSDIGVLRGGRPVLSTTATIGPHPIMMPVVEVSAIGAGGGSVVWGDRGGARPVLRVGPESVGADPGPAGYGLGGTRAALTDAYVHAGVIDPAAFLGGAFPLKPDLSTAALAAVADEADSVDADRTVDAALRVATAGMAARLRTVLAAHGDVPATFTFVAFGGAGGTHVALLAEDVGVGRVLVPAAAGTFCALGAAIAPLRRDMARTVRIAVDVTGRDELARAAAGIAGESRAWLRAQEPDATGTITLSADVRYAGQPTTLEVVLAEVSAGADPGPPDLDTDLDIAAIRRRFDAEHRRVHGFADAAAAVRVETVRASVTADLGEVRPGRAGGGFTGGVERDIRYDGAVRRATVHRFGPDGDRDRITGPAVVERPDTTVLVPAGWSATCDDAGTLHLVRGE